MVKAVLFDIDGTLIDSNEAHAASFAKAFKEFGKAVSFDELKCLIGMGADKILEKYLKKVEIEKFGEGLTERRKKIFLKEYLPDLKVFPKMRELMERLERDRIIITLASSASKEELEKYHELLRIDDLLNEETSSDDAEESKPDPDIFLAAFGKLKNIEKREVIVIGDTPYDAEAATKAGFKVYGVESGGWSREKLLDEGCASVYKDIGEILDNYDAVFKESKTTGV